jgi:hypothetical protein
MTGPSAAHTGLASNSEFANTFGGQEWAQLDIRHRAMFESCAMPPMHNPFPYERVAELIGDAESSRQSAVLHDAWRDYPAKATLAALAGAMEPRTG